MQTGSLQPVSTTKVEQRLWARIAVVMRPEGLGDLRSPCRVWATCYRSLIHDVHWCFTWFQGQPGSGEAAFDEAGPVLDLLQAVPDDLDQVAEAGDGEVGQHAAFEHRPDSFHRIQVRR